MVPGQANPQWDANLAALRAYCAEHGHVDVPTVYRTADGIALGSVLVELRHKRRRGRLSADRVAALEELGVDWPPNESVWVDFLAGPSLYGWDCPSVLWLRPAYGLISPQAEASAQKEPPSYG
ncbi:helicase associated domain-containing protein [Streptomyces microflavus]|uniref:helicase associated domain-containing protein n=1 Tax=Streptomyces microflavus TaxID=1919 RepID=UPI003318AA71